MASPIFKFRYHQTVYPAIDPAQPSLSAAGKTILITGGGKSIGKAITESFAIAGASHIVILGRELEALNKIRDDFQAKYPKTKIHVYAVDIADADRCREIFDEVKQDIAPIDVLVLNAGYLAAPSHISTMPMDDFWTCFEVNVKANTSLLQSFLRTCSPTNPMLINISSFLAWLGPIGFQAQAYAASKAAFDVVVRYLADQEREVRVFTLHPGSIVSPMSIKVGIDPTREGVYDDGESFSSFYFGAARRCPDAVQPCYPEPWQSTSPLHGENF